MQQTLRLTRAGPNCSNLDLQSKQRLCLGVSCTLFNRTGLAGRRHLLSLLLFPLNLCNPNARSQNCHRKEAGLRILPRFLGRLQPSSSGPAVPLGRPPLRHEDRITFAPGAHGIWDALGVDSLQAPARSTQYPSRFAWLVGLKQYEPRKPKDLHPKLSPSK